MESGIAKTTGKFGHLDSLRGLASLIVVFTHFAGVFFPFILDGTSKTHMKLEHLFYGTPLGILFTGNFSVLLFFVLSGFVLSIKFFQVRDMEILRQGAVKRYFRLMPPVAASILVALIFLKLGLFGNLAFSGVSGSLWIARLWNFDPHIRDAVYQAFYGAFITGTDSFNSLLWTMKIEFIGSFVVFGSVALFGQSKYRSLAWLGLLLAFWNTPYIAFIIGMAMAGTYAAHSERLSKLKRLPVIIVVLALLGLVLGSHPSDGPVQQTMFKYIQFPGLSAYSTYLIWQTVGASSLIAAVLMSTRLQSVLHNKTLLWLGRISFGLYLTHLIVLCSAGIAVFQLAFAWSQSYTASALIAFEVSLPLTLIVAHLFTNAVDKPSIKLANDIAKGRVVQNFKDIIRVVPEGAVASASSLALRLRVITGRLMELIGLRKNLD